MGAHRADPGVTMDPVMNEEATGFLSEAPVAHLGLVSEGKPYVTPMAFVVDDGRILFRTRPGRKLEAIAENPAVCIEACSFDESTGDWQSVIINGRAAEVTDPPSVSVQSECCSRSTPTRSDPLGIGGLQPLASTSHVIEVVIDEVTSMTSGSGLASQTAPRATLMFVRYFTHVPVGLGCGPGADRRGSLASRRMGGRRLPGWRGTAGQGRSCAEPSSPRRWTSSSDHPKCEMPVWCSRCDGVPPARRRCFPSWRPT